MEEVAKNISNILDIELLDDQEDENLPVPVESIDLAKDIDSDYEVTRSNLFELLYKNQKALEGILDVAKQTDQPRAYEVVGQFVKQQSDINKDIMDLHLKMKELENEAGPTSVTNNALFVGSTSELQKLIKGK